MSDIFSKRFSTAPSLPADQAETSAWRRALTLPSLPESHRSIPIAHNAHWFRKVLAFAGPGYLVAVGYMDPGNWATDIGGGSKFGYALLSVVLISNLMAMFLQALSAKLGIATGRDLAQACRDHYSRRTAMALWVMCEIAIAACDRGEAIRYAVLDSTLALGFALFVNAAILVLGAAAFHTRGLSNVAEIAEAYKLLSPVLGVSLASTVFACALLASGQNSTLTGTLSGQIVMEGVLEIRLKPCLRRLITRSIAITPAVLVIGIAGEGQVTSLIVLR